MTDRSKFLASKFNSRSLRKDPTDNRDYKFSKLSVVAPETIKLASSIPSMVDHSPKMSPVKFQGDLGSCVAFAACAMKEWQERKEYESEIAEGSEYRRTTVDYNLSEQWLYWNCKKIDPWPGEEGTNFRSAMKVLKSIGVPTEQAWPYVDDPINIGKPESWASLIARWTKIGSYWRITTLSELKTALVDGPVLIGIPCFDEIFEPKADGYVPMPVNPDAYYGDHAICVVGYDDTKSRVKFKNSWSQFWGNRGYGFLSYGYINKYMEDGWVASDIDVTPEMLKGSVSLSD